MNILNKTRECYLSSFFFKKRLIQVLRINKVIYKIERNFITKSYIKNDKNPKPVEGKVPSSLEQATGIEKYELLQKLSGKDAFDLKPLDASRLGTLKDPIVVESLDKTRLIGCTGFPVDSHDVLWFELSVNKENSRCPECGSVYKLNFTGGDIQNHH
ncbi:hypothetical protein PNEG_01814 [Pneumocystis murina B123]|uniref:Cytochrome c oxidase subunit 4, mitochondrial n=1 Tax=Pneumocystis murina (strain B123) TaxID=1069680 RepID=M7NN02_PNEMU|nr:hypothetical protein PNEG_01814 [Pneumocystis murina B123]EMR10063.1 hypothetical protein PNEG_01814 [Pneumocystis murina B123]